MDLGEEARGGGAGGGGGWHFMEETEDMTDGLSFSSRDVIHTRHISSNRESPLSVDLEAGLLSGKHRRLERGALLKGLMYGLINAVIVSPVMIGFAAIIFRHQAFHQDAAIYAQLVKLVIFSSAVHQTAFSAYSSLPFAIGQVQDAGLIFLSKIACSIADDMRDDPPEHMLATVLVALSLSTASLGVALIVTGKLQLAALVQYLPLPVVGGYLAFIGLYCLEAGLSLMTGEQVDSLLGLKAPSQWAALLSVSALASWLPGVVSGVCILLILQRYHHFLVLPSLLVLIPSVFYAVVFSSGYSLEDMRNLGLVAQSQPAGNPLRVWDKFDFSHVKWELLPSAIPTWFGMYVVVAFSSSLDVAAIQMDMGKQLDFNHELITIGISNLVSGCTGGFTGSYIFSQTIFTYRTGTSSRVCGIVVVVVELALFLAPFSIVAFMPKLFFGAVLTFIAVDLLYDWLVRSRSKVHRLEYGVILITFGAINVAGLELGMSAGVLVAMMCFIFDYAKVPVAQRVQLRSNVIRSLPRSALLAQLQSQVITMRCRGYIFFGSTLQIMEDVMSSIVSPPHDSRRSSNAYGANMPPVEEVAPVTTFVLFDFTTVSGLDATAARSCFLNLCRTLTPRGITLVFGGLRPGGHIEQLLIGHEILHAAPGNPSALSFETIDAALEYCEDALLRGSTGWIGQSQLSSSYVSLQATAKKGSGGLIRILSPLVEESWSDLLDGLFPFFVEQRYADNEVIFRKGDSAHSIYFITQGEVTLYNKIGSRGGSTPSKGRRLVRYVNGGIFGELDFFLRNVRSFDAVASTADCTVQMLSRESLQSMQSQASQLAAALEHALLKYLSFQVNAKLGLSDGIKDCDPID